MIILGQRIRLDPNGVQRTWLERCAGTARFAYNWGLARWQEMRAASEKPNWRILNAELNRRKKTDLSWMSELPWAVPNNALQDLGTAFSHFFRRVKAGARRKGYPHFKKRGRCREGFAIEARALKFDGRGVTVPKLGRLRTHEAVRFPGKILSARFSKRADYWYLSIQVEVDEDRWSYLHRCETQAAIGVDLGVRDLAVLSTGERIEAPRSLRRREARLRRLNKEMSRRRKGGRNREKTQAKLARLHERITNVRRDVTHKLTASIVRRFRWIGVENLNVSGMVRNRHLSKSIVDAAMAEVLRQLAYKAPLAGSVVVKAARFYQSSKTCSTCGVVRDEMSLGVRRWTCDACGDLHDRDENAAKNLEALAAAHAATACCHGSAGAGRETGTKLPLGQESGSVVNLS